MAFTREFVRKLAKESDIELPKELVNALMDEHITARDAYANEKVTEASNSTQQTDPKKTEEYKALEKSFNDFKASVEAEKTVAEKKTAYRDLLKSLGVAENRLDSILKITDFAKIELDNGSLKGEKELSESIKTEWADFIVQTDTLGAATNNPPATQTLSKSKSEIMAIKDTAERQKEIALAIQKGEM